MRSVTPPSLSPITRAHPTLIRVGSKSHRMMKFSPDFALLALCLLLSSIIPAFARPSGFDIDAAFDKLGFKSPKEEKKAISYSDCQDICFAKFPAITQKDSVFWTGGALSEDTVHKFIDERLHGKGLWYEDIYQKIGDRKWLEVQQEGLSDDQRWRATARSSQAFAANSKGTAWLLIPAGVDETNPYPRRWANWVHYEYNQLTRNALINKIVRVNVDDFDDQQVLWTKGDPAFGKAPDHDTEPVFDGKGGRTESDGV